MSVVSLQEDTNISKDATVARYTTPMQWHLGVSEAHACGRETLLGMTMQWRVCIKQAGYMTKLDWFASASIPTLFE